MPLLDTATRLNKELLNQRIASARIQEKAAFQKRKYDLFEKNGAKWFADLGEAVQYLAAEFNNVVEDSSKLLKVAIKRPESIEVCQAGATSPPHPDSRCVIALNASDLSVFVELYKLSRCQKETFTVLPSEDDVIKVIVNVMVQKTAWPEDDGRKPTGDIFVDLRSYSEKMTKRMGAKEFADFVLDRFVTFS